MRLPILCTVMALLLLPGCFPPLDDGGPGGPGDVGTQRDAGGDGGDGGGSFKDAGTDAGGARDAGVQDAGPADAGSDAGPPPGPCDGWPATRVATPGCGPAPLRVDFDSTALEDAYLSNGCSYYGVVWEFGDGSSSSLDFPTHTFDRGDYLAKASGDGECCSGGTCTTLGLNLSDIPIRSY